jgi:hypothetical protein
MEKFSLAKVGFYAKLKAKHVGTLEDELGYANGKCRRAIIRALIGKGV